MNFRSRIYKHDGSWWLVRPAFGFAPTPGVQRHDTWQSAMDSATRRGPGSAGPSVERTRTPAGVWKHNRRHDNWPVEVR